MALALEPGEQGPECFPDLGALRVALERLGAGVLISPRSRRQRVQERLRGFDPLRRDLRAPLTGVEVGCKGEVARAGEPLGDVADVVVHAPGLLDHDRDRKRLVARRRPREVPPEVCAGGLELDPVRLQLHGQTLCAQRGVVMSAAHAGSSIWARRRRRRR